MLAPRAKLRCSTESAALPPRHAYAGRLIALLHAGRLVHQRISFPRTFDISLPFLFGLVSHKILHSRILLYPDARCLVPGDLSHAIRMHKPTLASLLTKPPSARSSIDAFGNRSCDLCHVLYSSRSRASRAVRHNMLSLSRAIHHELCHSDNVLDPVGIGVCSVL